MPTRAELDFAAAWLRGDHREAWYQDTANSAETGIAFRADGPPYDLTPAGADLLATIETLGIDPETARADDDPPEPEDRFCARCGNTGEIPIIGEFCNPCPDCKRRNFGFFGVSSGHVSSDRPSFSSLPRAAAPEREIVRESVGIFEQHYPCPTPDASGLHDGWTLIDSEETAKRFVGKTVEIDVPASDIDPQHYMHGSVSTVIKAKDRFLVMDDHGCIAYNARGNVRLREVRDPIAQAARRSQQDDWTWQHVQLAGVSGVVVPEPQPDPDPPGFGED